MRWENTLRHYFTDNGWTVINSNRSGYDGDDMRIREIPWLSIEAKDQVKLKLAEWVKQASEQSVNGTDAPVVVHKRGGTTDVGAAYVTMTLETFTQILSKLGSSNGDS
jgi:hypothetical protein